ncbi:DUF3025 domain-containing protein [Chitinilyticum piscinae]|uniref:DUF3025 domain-containing protein n=1 Tax=Chitinilyticum piscinae TaxID=2866724 RepID=A0A8J7KBG3_9NEIS|nr:DUF3025 domain-containing protein [Chitinilyticum piscinae]MBE9610204.1 DUF3025 domain-containing protein [Chitinilyticum piscinae]
MSTRPVWPHPAFAHPAFVPFRALLARLPEFPEYADWERLGSPVCLPAGAPIRFVPPETITLYYELAIASAGTVATRHHDWHDCFNAVIWHHFPHSKLAFNALHQQEIERQGSLTRRGPRRDAATLLDECGMLIASSDPALLDALAQRNWSALFKEEHWGVQISATIIGHATLESLLAPFTGLTAKCVPVLVPEAFFTLPHTQQLRLLDRTLARALAAGWLESPRQLPVLPWLGIPGWWPHQDPAFYADTTHFCPLRAGAAHGSTAAGKNPLTLAIHKADTP